MSPWVRNALRWGPLVSWMAIIYLFSSRPDLPHMEQLWLELLIRKLAHALEYGILGALLARAIGVRGWRAVALAITLGALYAASDEWHQTFVLGRHGSAWDVLLDSASVMVGVCCYARMPALSAKKRSHAKADSQS